MTENSAIRHDILSLTEEKLTQLANAGLVKRANKALENGDIPKFSYQAGKDKNDTLISEFTDAHIVTWHANQALPDSECTCPAPLCRHRVQTVLAYRHAFDNPAVAISSPHTISRESIENFANSTLIKKAMTLCKHGLTLKLIPVQNTHCASAILPMASVKFWGGENLNEATCDCLQKQQCEHILLASLAYHSLDSEPTQSLDIVIDSQQIEQFFAKKSPKSDTEKSKPTAQPISEEKPSLKTDNLTAQEIELLSALLEDGATIGLSRYQRLFQDINDQLSKSKELWLQAVLADIKNWLTAYENRRSDFDSEQGFDLVTEYALRTLARQNPSLHNSVLGIGLAHETPIATARLVSVGGRIRPNHAVPSTDYSDSFIATVMLFDSKTQTLLSYQHPFSLAHSLDRQQRFKHSQNVRLSSHISLSQLATGQLTCQRAKRMANHKLYLNFSRKNYNQLLPQQGDWEPIAKTSQANMTHQRNLPSFLQGRYQQPNFVVVKLCKILQHGYDPANQQYVIVGKDKEDNEWLVTRQFQAYTPFALHTMAIAISQDSRTCLVAGTMTTEKGINRLDLWSIVTDKLYVLDMDDSIHLNPKALQNAPTLYLANPTISHNTVEQALLEVKNLCHQRLITGRQQQTFEQFVQSLSPYATRFQQLGLRQLSEWLSDIVQADNFKDTAYLLIRMMVYIRLYLS